MNKDEARQMLSEQLAQYRDRHYGDLMTLIGKRRDVIVVGPSGTKYGIEIQVVWDDRPGGDIRVLGTVDDGGLRAFLPLTESIIIER